MVSPGLPILADKPGNRIDFSAGESPHTPRTAASEPLDAGVLRAVAVIAATNNDLANLEIGLSANALSPAVRVVLRIFDEELASNTAARLGIDFASSTSHLAAAEFLGAAGFAPTDPGY